MRFTPLVPASAARQKSSLPMPFGLTTPIPVMTTHLFIRTISDAAFGVALARMLAQLLRDQSRLRFREIIVKDTPGKVCHQEFTFRFHSVARSAVSAISLPAYSRARCLTATLARFAPRSRRLTPSLRQWAASWTATWILSTSAEALRQYLLPIS